MVTPSILITPNYYGEDKLLSIIPTDGSGDLNVVRATTATRVNSEGLIEVTPYNLLQRSEQFDNAYWVKQNCTITANSVVDPDGNTTADSLIASNGTATFKGLYTTESTIAPKTFSFYIKKGNKDWVMLLGFNGTNNCWFNISNGTLGTIGSNFINATIDNVGNGWFRCSATLNSSVTALGNLGIYFSDSDNSTSCTGDGTSVSGYLWGAQLVSGTSAKEYFPTTDRLDVPRLDYTNGGCPSILVEPQRTNLLLRSEEFDNAYWTKTNATITANTTTSPDGNLTADKLIENTNTAPHYIESVNIGGAGVKPFSIYVKAGELSKVAIRDAFSTGAYVSFDLTSGTIISEFLAVGSIFLSANGFYRISIIQSSYTANSRFQIFLLPNTYSGGSVINSYLGDGTSGVYLWGAQAEVGSNATSYIPTVASTSTRNADVISKTGISNLIGQTEGTLFVDFNFINNNSEGRMSISNGTNSDRILIIKNISNTLRFFVSRSNIAQLDFTTINSFLNNQKIKIAVSLKTANFKIFINGVIVYTQNTGTYPLSLQQFSFTDALLTSPFIGNVKQVQLYKEALTDEQLIALTTI